MQSTLSPNGLTSLLRAARAAVFAGEPLPVDVSIKLGALGFNVAALEQRLQEITE